MSIKYRVPLQKLKATCVVHNFEKNLRQNIWEHMGTHVSPCSVSYQIFYNARNSCANHLCTNCSNQIQRLHQIYPFFRNGSFGASRHCCNHRLHQPGQGVLYRRAGHRCEELLQLCGVPLEAHTWV